eukprot:gnl/TRDRNA2_/TRDRNA2_54094_c0_seq1.p1 gnl/TRDRNA2_/TRDRNA2_54094_c0~~gnl/TRDRNA2_/TRDRNA2_54094_c0_seq1.p1  ORF type:complete len:190 (+),score=21.92 gnl/TRDRNA2_/TRDRNA2_54094_c0_seq1:319-888(+)
MLARGVERHIAKLSAQNLANVAWACAVASWSDAPLCAVLVKAAHRCAREFSAQGIVNIAWAFARMSRSDALLFRALAKVAEHRARDFNPLDFAPTAWAFVTACHSLPISIDPLATEVHNYHADVHRLAGNTQIAAGFAEARGLLSLSEEYRSVFFSTLLEVCRRLGDSGKNGGFAAGTEFLFVLPRSGR